MGNHGRGAVNEVLHLLPRENATTFFERTVKSGGFVFKLGATGPSPVPSTP